MGETSCCAVGIAMAIAGAVCFSLCPIFISSPRRMGLDEITTPVQSAGALLVLGGVLLVMFKAAR